MFGDPERAVKPGYYIPVPKMLDFTLLKRAPDFESENLYAYDSSDKLILETAADSLASVAPSEIVIIGDRYGAITLGAITLGDQNMKDSDSNASVGAGIRVFQDSLISERALAQNAERLGYAAKYQNMPLDKELLRGARIVLMQLPKSLRELTQIADAVARWAADDVKIFAGGRVKHMNLAMNEVLANYFFEVKASLAKQKSRVILAAKPKKVSREQPFPEWSQDADLPFKLAGFGATFGGTKLDHGTRLLLKSLREDLEKRQTEILDKKLKIVDLGCGNGAVATSLALTLPEAQIVATDVSYAAVQATNETLERASVAHRVRVQRADGCEGVAAGSADIVVLNPPFHTGTEVNEGLARKLIVSAADALRTGGELWLVMNSHLQYRAMLSRIVGETSQISKDARFTVLRSVKS